MDYITNEFTIIFSPKYNRPLEPELLSQSHYKKIIFSDWNLNDWILPDMLFKDHESENFKNINKL